ncbi:MAG: hypothetical protein ACRENO_00240 [Thermodesulfobacteriota bacterium]
MSDSKRQTEKKKIINWNQTRVPNIKKGYNPNYPFYMMAIFFIFLILSIIFAKITS